MREMVGGCCVCSDDRGWSENPLVYCDGQSCTVAVHQACYGIVSVPTGPWYCRKCESQERTTKVKCELCPSRYGALKRTDNAGWAHVVCALYIPEVRFGNVTTMEPIQLQLIPAERFSKVCYICEEKGRPANASIGACMQCNRAGCKQQFHVTCAQSLGLLCEEAGNYLDNVKYCGYCQHHYSKLKGGNVKTIPPYKPVSTESHLSDSNSEKEAEGLVPTPATSSSKTAPSNSTTSTNSSSSSGKRKSTSNSKSSSSSKSSGNSKSSSSSPNNSKTSSHQNSKSSDKSKVNNSSSTSRTSRNVDDHSETLSDTKTDKKDSKSEPIESESKGSELKESKASKKRKAHSRTPTPVSTVESSAVSVVVSSNNQSSAAASNLGNSTVDKGDFNSSGEILEKIKKAKVETTQSIISNQPVVALTSITTIKPTPPRPATPLELPVVPPESTTSSIAALSSQSIIQSTANHSPINSLVVSVPLSSTSLSPHSALSNNNQNSSVLIPNIGAVPQQDKSNNIISSLVREDLSNNLDSLNLEEDNPQSTMHSSEMSGGGLKIAYEKQEAMSINNTEEDMELEEIQTEVPAKRTRSQSNDKTERPATTSRGKKRNSAANLGGNSNSLPISNSNSNISMTSRRASRSQQNISPPTSQSSTQNQPGAFSSISQNQLKNSPPSSPSSESQGAPTTTGRNKAKGRKSAPAIITPSSSVDSKDVKLFQNGVSAPHMLGNQLNPNSNMAQKMSDHLNSELEAHSIFNPNENANHVGPQLHQRVVASARSNSTGSTASGNSGLSGMLGGSSGNIPQTLDQLLERQWEQGSQFLMEQAQHFDIASLLSCLHQLRAENLRLEEHVSSLLQRRDHLLAVNARLAIPLTGQPATPQSSHPHTVNNIHPAVAPGHSDIPRSRHSTGSASYPAHPQGSSVDGPIENGLPPDPSQAYSTHHRSPAPGQPQRSPTVRW
ncbi:hypothetical protein HHI36_006267 [Cryptolaemus montrouzieri]|uniref:Protein AF-10 n=1 Tax=Cryptolaemus montrouzieri TaxID=559131 RepID=A0ABD2NWN2_9CUCU